MRTIAVIFLLIGSYFLLRAMGYIPVQVQGHEGVVIEALAVPIVGATASLIGLLFAGIDFGRRRRRQFFFAISVWCFAQILGFVVLFLSR